MQCSSGKKYHATERDALNDLAWMRKQPGGHGLKHLNVFQCKECEGFHVGRAWRGSREIRATLPKPEPTPKPLTEGQQRRKARIKAEFDARQAVYADWHDTLMHVRLMVDAEITRLEALGVPKRTVGTSTAEIPAAA